MVPAPGGERAHEPEDQHRHLFIGDELHEAYPGREDGADDDAREDHGPRPHVAVEGGQPHHHQQGEPGPGKGEERNGERGGAVQTEEQGQACPERGPGRHPQGVGIGQRVVEDALEHHPGHGQAAANGHGAENPGKAHFEKHHRERRVHALRRVAAEFRPHDPRCLKQADVHVAHAGRGQDHEDKEERGRDGGGREEIPVMFRLRLHPHATVITRRKIPAASISQSLRRGRMRNRALSAVTRMRIEARSAAAIQAAEVLAALWSRFSR